MNEEKNKQFSIKFKPSLMAKVEDYIEAVNDNKKPSEKKLNKASFFNDVVANYFEDKVLTNDVMALDKPFYFNWLELKEKGVITASTELLNHALETSYVVHAVPNNLDSWNSKEGTYSSGSNSSVHKGSYTFFLIIHDSGEYYKVKKIVEKNLLFKYDSSTNSLEITLLADKDLYLYVPVGSNVLEQLEEKKVEFYNTITDSEDMLNLPVFFTTFEVIFPYKATKELLMNMDSSYFKKIEEGFVNAESYTYETEEGSIKGFFIPSDIMEGFYKIFVEPTNIELESDKK